MSAYPSVSAFPPEMFGAPSRVAPPPGWNSSKMTEYTKQGPPNVRKQKPAPPMQLKPVTKKAPIQGTRLAFGANKRSRKRRNRKSRKSRSTRRR